MEQEKLCRTCKYFKRYYFKMGNGFYMSCKGNCIHIKATVKIKAKCFDNFVCEKWEQSENIQTDTQEHIEDLLRNVYSNLNELWDSILKQ